MMATNQPKETDENNVNGTTTTTEKEKVVETEGSHNQQATTTKTTKRQQQQRRPSILITGFGPFQDIPINPTTIIVNELRDYLISSNEVWKQNLVHHIQDCIVMDTSVDNVCKTLDSYYQQQKQQKQLNEEEEEMTNNNNNNNNNNNTTTAVVVDIILHLGVHYKAKGFHIEQYAYNDATFRIPDECGYQPKGELIVNTKQLGESIQTQINVEELVENQKELFSNVITNLSDNPGRFVCNYTYCYSLYHLDNNNKNDDEGKGEEDKDNDVINEGIANDNNKSNNNHKTKLCLFLHVPKFEVVSKEIQFEYISTLIQKLIELHQQTTTTTTNTNTNTAEKV